MKIKKNQRKIITITILIILILLIIYIFNIFNFKNILRGTKIEKNTTDYSTITTMNGKSISLPEEYIKSNINILENDKIIEYVKNEENSTSKIKSIITVETQKNINDVFNDYTAKFSNPMTYETNNTKTIITGNAQNLIKIIISNKQYKIEIEQR